MSDLIDVDNVWETLGRWGSYQKRQLIVNLLTIWSCGFHMLSVVYIGYRPEHVCCDVSNTSLPDNDTFSVKQTFEQCSVLTAVNRSGIVTVTEEKCTSCWAYTEGGHFARERSFVSEWSLVCGREELTELSQTLLMIGQAAGAFFATSLADKYGRKTVHVLCHVSLFFVTFGTGFAPNYTVFAILRFLLGVFQQGTGLTVAIMNLELFPKEVRGMMEVLGLCFWTTGIALITPIAYLVQFKSWRYLQIILACLSSWSLIQWWLTDESLRWLIANGKVKESKRVLRKACKINKKDFNEVCRLTGFREYELHFDKRKDIHSGDVITKSLVEGIESNGVDGHEANGVKKKTETVSKAPKATAKYTIVDLVKTKRIFIVSLIMWFAWVCNSVTYYGIMLISSSLAGNRFLNFFLGSVVEYPAAFIIFMIIDRRGRKFTSIFFHTVCGVSLMIATVLVTVSSNAAMVLSSTVFTLIGKFAITGSFSCIFLFTPELYPTNMRNLGIGMSSAAARAGGMLAPFSRNLADMYVWAPGLIFGVMCLIVAVSMLWVPETNRYELPQTIEECEEWFKNNQFKLGSCCGNEERNKEKSAKAVVI